jgi:hypothetical protein
LQSERSNGFWSGRIHPASTIGDQAALSPKSSVLFRFLRVPVPSVVYRSLTKVRLSAPPNNGCLLDSRDFRALGKIASLSTILSNVDRIEVSDSQCLTVADLDRFTHRYLVLKNKSETSRIQGATANAIDQHFPMQSPLEGPTIFNRAEDARVTFEKQTIQSTIESGALFYYGSPEIVPWATIY